MGNDYLLLLPVHTASYSLQYFQDVNCKRKCEPEGLVNSYKTGRESLRIKNQIMNVPNSTP